MFNLLHHNPSRITELRDAITKCGQAITDGEKLVSYPIQYFSHNMVETKPGEQIKTEESEEPEPLSTVQRKGGVLHRFKTSSALLTRKFSSLSDGEKKFRNSQQKARPGKVTSRKESNPLLQTLDSLNMAMQETLQKLKTAQVNLGMFDEALKEDYKDTFSIFDERVTNFNEGIERISQVIGCREKAWVFGVDLEDYKRWFSDPIGQANTLIQQAEGAITEGIERETAGESLIKKLIIRLNLMSRIMM